MAISEDPDKMRHNAAIHQGMYCLLRLKQPSRTEIRHNTENFTCDPLKYTMCSPILMVSICMGKSIKIQQGEVPQGGTLIFSAYVGSDPASALHPQKISGISSTPNKYLKF